MSGDVYAGLYCTAWCVTRQASRKSSTDAFVDDELSMTTADLELTGVCDGLDQEMIDDALADGDEDGDH